MGNKPNIDNRAFYQLSLNFYFLPSTSGWKENFDPCWSGASKIKYYSQEAVNCSLKGQVINAVGLGFSLLKVEIIDEENHVIASHERCETYMRPFDFEFNHIVTNSLIKIRVTHYEHEYTTNFYCPEKTMSFNIQTPFV